MILDIDDTCHYSVKIELIYLMVLFVSTFKSILNWWITTMDFISEFVEYFWNDSKIYDQILLDWTLFSWCPIFKSSHCNSFEEQAHVDLIYTCVWSSNELRYDCMTSSNGNIFHVTGHLCGEFTGPGKFPTQRPVTRSFDVFFDLRLNKRLSKQWWGWWFEMLSRPLWRHCNGAKD